MRGRAIRGLGFVDQLGGAGDEALVGLGGEEIGVAGNVGFLDRGSALPFDGELEHFGFSFVHEGLGVGGGDGVRGGGGQEKQDRDDGKIHGRHWS